MPKPARGPAAPGGLSSSNLDEVRQQDIRSRLARIEGHVRALARQFDTGADCDDLLTQAAAVRAAMSALMARLIEAHIEMCIKPCARRGEAEEALEGLKAAFTTALRQV